VQQSHNSSINEYFFPLADTLARTHTTCAHFRALCHNSMLPTEWK